MPDTGRGVLREFDPIFLVVFTGRFALIMSHLEARAVLAIAPTPAAAAKLSVNRIAAALLPIMGVPELDLDDAGVPDGVRNS